VELSPGPAAQPRHHSRTVPTTTDETSFSGSMNAALCDLRYVAPYKNIYLLIYLLTYVKSEEEEQPH